MNRFGEGEEGVAVKNEQAPDSLPALHHAGLYLFLYAPIVLLIVFSFNAGRSNRVWGGFSLQWYVELFQDTRLLGGLRTTIWSPLGAGRLHRHHLLGTAAAIGFTACAAGPAASACR